MTLCVVNLSQQAVLLYQSEVLLNMCIGGPRLTSEFHFLQCDIFHQKSLTCPLAPHRVPPKGPAPLFGYLKQKLICIYDMYLFHTYIVLIVVPNK